MKAESLFCSSVGLAVSVHTEYVFMSGLNTLDKCAQSHAQCQCQKYDHCYLLKL